MAESHAPASAGGLRPFAMPSLGADMEAGTILAWRVQPGDRVKRGDIVAEIETEKAEMEVEVFEDGVVAQILVAVGEQVAVGTPIALIACAGSAASSPPFAPAEPPVRTASATPPPAPHAPPPDVAVQPAPAPIAQAPELADAARRAPRLHATPLARRLAEELDVALASLTGSGPGGAIRAEDVRAAADLQREPARTPAPQPQGPTVPRLATAAAREASRQRVVAALMERSKREIPHYYLSASFDLSGALAWLEARNRRRGLAQRVLPAALLLRAVALAVREAPGLNGHYADGAFRGADALHLAVAIGLRSGGLVAPAILDAQTKSLDELMGVMTKKRIRHMPVVEGGRLVGIVSIGDVVKRKIDDIEREAAALKEYIAS